MGLFSKTPKLNPKIIVEGIEIQFRQDGEYWEFTYRGTEFVSGEYSLTLPSKAELDAILEALNALKSEMQTRLVKGLCDFGGAKLNDGESYLLDIKDFATEQTFTVSWSDGKSWGDLRADFTIKDRAILDEDWGD